MSSGGAFKALSLAIVKGFIRDRTSVFFALIFPLMFLVLFGGLFADPSQSKVDMIQVGDVSLVEDLPEGAKEAFDETFEVEKSDDLDDALSKVRKGDADVAIEMQGDTLVAHYTQTDQVKAAVTQGTLRSFVDGTNVALLSLDAGAPPKYSLEAERVEDDSLKTIQFYTPGLLGWAVAMSASFGAAATLQGWRQSKLIRRLQLAPVSTRTVVGARVGVTIGIALVQMADLRRARRSGVRADPHRLLVDVDPAARGRHPLLHVDRPAGRCDHQDHRGRGQRRELHGAAHGVPVRVVLPAGCLTGVAAGLLERPPAQAPERRDARRDGPR